MMGYLKIPNLYKDQRVLAFREVYALEKVHGTSAHIRWCDGQVSFYGGGTKHETFAALFDAEALAARFVEMGHPDVTVYGESFGGKCQGMSATYGSADRFLVFDVKVGDTWLAVENAHKVTARLGLGFVPFELVPATVDRLNEERDRPSRVAVVPGKPAEGIVVRPPFEVTASDGDRIIAKHKRSEFRETSTERQVEPGRAVVLFEAKQVAEEWVTPMRLEHVLQRVPATSMSDIPKLIAAMNEDIAIEGADEFAPSPAVTRAIGAKTVELFKRRLESGLST